MARARARTPRKARDTTSRIPHPVDVEGIVGFEEPLARTRPAFERIGWTNVIKGPITVD